MGKGKDICKLLRQIRQQLADENNIVYHPTECHFKGDCKGTCPKCESEVRYIEQQLSLREKAKKAIKIIGLAAGVTAIAADLTSCKEDGDIEPDDLTLKYKEETHRGYLHLDVPKEGGTFHCSCDALYPNVCEFYNTKETYKVCLLDKENNPQRIVKRSIDHTMAPILSNDTLIDSNDLLIDWIKVKTESNNNITITVEPNKESERNICIRIVDKNSMYGNIYITQEGEITLPRGNNKDRRSQN